MSVIKMNYIGLIVEYQEIKKENRKLKKENEKLKSENQDLREVLGMVTGEKQ